MLQQSNLRPTPETRTADVLVVNHALYCAHLASACNVLPEQFTPARLDSDDIWSLIAATTVHLDDSLADADITEKFRTDVAVTTRDGAVHRVTVPVPHGAPTDPVTNDELVAKFHALADRVTSHARAEAIERAVVDLDNLDDIKFLVDLLAGPVAGALD